MTYHWWRITPNCHIGCIKYKCIAIYRLCLTFRSRRTVRVIRSFVFDGEKLICWEKGSCKLPKSFLPVFSHILSPNVLRFCHCHFLCRLQTHVEWLLQVWFVPHAGGKACAQTCRSTDRVDGTTTSLPVGWSAIPILAWAKDFSLICNLHTMSGVQPTSYSMGTGVLSRR